MCGLSPQSNNQNTTTEVKLTINRRIWLLTLLSHCSLKTFKIIDSTLLCNSSLHGKSQFNVMAVNSYHHISVRPRWTCAQRGIYIQRIPLCWYSFLLDRGQGWPGTHPHLYIQSIQLFHTLTHTHGITDSCNVQKKENDTEMEMQFSTGAGEQFERRNLHTTG